MHGRFQDLPDGGEANKFGSGILPFKIRRLMSNNRVGEISRRETKQKREAQLCEYGRWAMALFEGRGEWSRSAAKARVRCYECFEVWYEGLLRTAAEGEGCFEILVPHL